MEGYIILDVTCKKLLTKGLFWFEHESRKDGFVFSDVGVSFVKNVSEKWDIVPAYKQMASWNGERVEILGNLEPFWD